MSGLRLTARLTSLVFFTCIGCGGGGARQHTLSSISVSPTTVAAGYVSQLAATGTYADGAVQDLTASVSWTSSDGAKATVDSTGLATGVSPGLVSITASLDGVSGSVTLTVEDPPTTNGTVCTIATGADGVTYIGGDFTQVGPFTGSFAPVDTASGKLPAIFPKVDGWVYASVSDGNGGWFIGGTFTKVGGLERNHLAHINVDGTVDSNWNTNVDGLSVRALVIGQAVSAPGTLPPPPPPGVPPGTVLYVGGDFRSIGGQERRSLAALYPDSGAVKDWKPGIDYGVIETLALSSLGFELYVGGIFSLTSVGSQTKYNLAALEAATANALDWYPQPDNEVDALVVSDNTVYAAGSFSAIGGKARKNLAALAGPYATDSVPGTALDWNPDVNNEVHALAMSGSTVYIGGDFTSAGGKSRNHIAALDRWWGNVLDWNPDADGSVYALAVSNSTVYAGGYFTSIGGQKRNYLAALAGPEATMTVPGSALNWNPIANGVVLTLRLSRRLVNDPNISPLPPWYGWTYRDDPDIQVGGQFSGVGGQLRNQLAAIDASGHTTDWNPDPLIEQPPGGQAFTKVTVLALGTNAVYVGGYFTSIGGQPRKNLAALDTASGSATDWNPNTNGDIYALTVSGNTVYVGGYFESIGGQPRKGIAALDASSGSATDWNPDADGGVYALAVNGDTVYAGGAFKNIGGQIRSNLAALDASSGSATDWHPDADGRVAILAANNNVVYVAGDFTQIGGQVRNHLAALDTSSGGATDWNPDPQGSGYEGEPPGAVFALAMSANIVYVGGTFMTIGGSAKSRLAALDASSGQATDWNADADDGVLALALSSNSVFVGGGFKNIGGEDIFGGFARLDR